MTPSSRIQRAARMHIQEMGDGVINRIPDGINNTPAVFTIVYENLSPAEHVTLGNFVRPHLAAGTTLTIPCLPEDPTGATTGLFYIVSSNNQPDQFGSLFNWTIQCREVFE
jgi:phage-related protein